MGITIPAKRLEFVLEQAVALAESDVRLPEEWTHRTLRISDCPSKTYIAAFGTALLAQATDSRVDVLTVKSGAGPTAYSMRGVVKVLASRAAHYGYHLGVTKKEPLNNQPWYGGSRIDRFTTVRDDAKPYHRDLIRYLNDLNQLKSEEAKLALAAFIRVRQEYQRADEERAAAISAPSGGDLEGLLEILEIFLNDDPEHGRRGQALAAAVLDFAHDDVHLASIHDPTGLDVSVRQRGRPVLGVEVKQKLADEGIALQLAKAAREAGSHSALLLALAPDQRPLDREVIRSTAFGAHGVIALVCETVAEFVAHVLGYGAVDPAAFIAELPTAYLRRMQEHEVSAAGQQYWADLCVTLGSPTAS
jgi:hypothetical protein